MSDVATLAPMDDSVEKKQRRKSDAQRKEESIRIRVTEAQKRTLTRAATKAGLGVSSWLLSVGLQAAAKGPGG